MTPEQRRALLVRLLLVAAAMVVVGAVLLVASDRGDAVFAVGRFLLSTGVGALVALPVAVALVKRTRRG